jgi:hypothetical protein
MLLFTFLYRYEANELPVPSCERKAFRGAAISSQVETRIFQNPASQKRSSGKYVRA